MSLEAKHIQMVDDCMERQSCLNEWEADFLDSIAFRLNGGKTLTVNMEKKLGQIWEKVTDEMPTVRRR